MSTIQLVASGPAHFSCLCSGMSIQSNVANRIALRDLVGYYAHAHITMQQYISKL